MAEVKAKRGQPKGSSASATKRSKLMNGDADMCPYTRDGRTDGPLKCTWQPDTGADVTSPHTRIPFVPNSRPLILDNIMGHIGGTPMVRINRIAAEEGLQCELLAKCEFFNPGGSVKDRIALRMVQDAEASGRIRPGDTLIEPTSGNTGIGLALAAALKGYRCIITLPEKMSKEKVDVLKALGAEIIRTPTEAAFDSPESHIGVARRLNEEIANSHILDQYTNPSNPLAHYDATAEEILHQCSGKLDMIVLSAGTGGTLTGVARKLREKLPHIQIIGVDPVGSILAEPESLNDNNRLESYKVEGIGYDFIPAVLDRSLVDTWIKTNDRESFITSRRLIREEGLLCGGSSGSAMCAALQCAKKLGPGQRCVVLLPDSVRNYMSKFLSDEWMYENDMVDISSVKQGVESSWWADRKVSELALQTPHTITPSVTCKEAITLLAKEGYSMIPVVSTDNKEVMGVVTEGNLNAQLTTGRVQPSDDCTRVMYRQFKKVSLNTPLKELARWFDKDHFALVVTEQRCYSGGAHSTITVISGVVTRIDLLNYISSNVGTS